MRASVPHLRRLSVLSLLAFGTACTSKDAPRTTTTVFAAGSLARPLRAALDSIEAGGGATVQLEVMGSRELLRAITSLGRTPDLVVSADADELEAALIPGFVTSSTVFARNRVVLALSPKRAISDTVTTINWADVASSGALRIARADPGRAPLGFRTQMVWQLAESSLQRPGLAARLAAASPQELMRGNESDLAALLESGDADAAWCYESLARSLNVPYVRLGDAVDLGSDADSVAYRSAAVRIAGAAPGDSVTVTGTPIRYAIAVLKAGPDVIGATMLRTRLLDSNSVRIMRRIGLDVLENPRVVTGTARPVTRQ
ncbi:MAG: extracellular solute-binding protein [Gemmatimonadota bacterium]